MLQGHQSWVFASRPVIAGAAAVGGPFEAQGALAEDFDLLHEDIWLGQNSFEKAEKMMLEQATELAISHAGVKQDDVQFFLCGDLLNQIISSSFTARTLGIPFIGLYGACSSSMEGLALASLLVDSGFAHNVLAGTSSHNAAAEKQYRYPTEYGSQKPPTAQWTVTGAGAALVSGDGQGPRVTGGNHRPRGGHGIVRSVQHGRRHGSRGGRHDRGSFPGLRAGAFMVRLDRHGRPGPGGARDCRRFTG